MKQESKALGPLPSVTRIILPSQSLSALLALVGAKRMEVSALRERTKLTPSAFGKLMEWIQREHLVDVVSTLEGGEIRERVLLTEKGEAALVGMLERTCELPELR